MTKLELLEKRRDELRLKAGGNPMSEKELEDYKTEILYLAKTIEHERAKEYSGLIEELKMLGINITSIWDFVNTKEKYPKAITLLLKYLPQVKYERSKEGIIRALTVKEAKGVAVPILIKEYLNIPKEKENLRWVIGNAVFATVTKNDVDLIIPIVLDKSNGSSRDMFIFALGKIKGEKVKNVLIQAMDDNDKEIRDAVKKVLKKVYSMAI